MNNFCDENINNNNNSSNNNNTLMLLQNGYSIDYCCKNSLHDVLNVILS